MAVVPFLLFLVPVVSAGLCPEGTFYDVHFKKCFLFHEDRANFFDAEETCLKHGGHLVTIDKGFANWYIFDVAKEKDIHKYWIGANRVLSLNFQWTSREKFNRRNWAFKAVETNPELRCVAVFLEQWSIEDCNTEFSFVCEVEPNHNAASDFWENIQEIIGQPVVDLISEQLEKEIPQKTTRSTTTEETTTTTTTTEMPVTKPLVTKTSAPHKKPTTPVTHRVNPTTAKPPITNRKPMVTKKATHHKPTTKTTTPTTATATTAEETTTTLRTTPELTTTTTQESVRDVITLALESTTESSSTVQRVIGEIITIPLNVEISTESTTTASTTEMDTSTVAGTTTFTTEGSTTQELGETTTIPIRRAVLVNTTKVISKSCSEGWKFYNMWCYKAFSDKVSWLESTKVCSQEKANLVSIYSKEENDFVHDLVSNDSWIGLFDENGWDWIGSHDVTAPVTNKPFENWLLRVQDFNQGCAKMLKNMLGKWYPLSSEKCSNLVDSKANQAGFVCKKDAGEIVFNTVHTQTIPLPTIKREVTVEEQKPKQKRNIQFGFDVNPFMNI